MDTSDILATIALVISCAFGAFTWMQQRKANSHAKRSAEASEQSAHAADRSAVAAEEVAAIERQRHQAELQAAAPKVKLVVEGSGNTRLMRNIGDLEATGVRVDRTNLRGGIARDVPNGDVNLAPNAAVRMVLEGSWGNPLPSELLVTWDGQSEPVHVPL